MLLSQLVISDNYKDINFSYYSNKIISIGKFVFEKTNISKEAQREGIANKLWELSESLTKKVIR